MYGSYGSYSSMGFSQVSALDFGRSSSSSTCAFPSWPRRNSLAGGHSSSTASSYLSDEDLYWGDSCDDSASTTSSSTSSTPSGSNSSSVSPQFVDPAQHYQHYNNHYEQYEQRQQPVVERAVNQRELVRVVLAEKEQRKAARRAARKASGGHPHATTSRKSGKKAGKLTAIAETGVESA